MTHAINRDELPHSGIAHKFEGYRYGETNVSFFLTEGDDITFTVGEAMVEATGGQIVVVPAGVAHGFVNSGGVPLRQVAIHAGGRMVTEWLEG